MFTGIIEETGTISRLDKRGHSIKLAVSCKKVLGNTRVGDSISTDGVCLTVTCLHQDAFEADIMPKTFRISSFSSMKIGDKVNLERALQLNDRLGGHLVSGHVDGLGRISQVHKDEIAYRIKILCDRSLLKYMMPRGSITIDGISLTLVSVNEMGFEVSVIPQTQDDTTLLNKTIGQSVNIENDMIAKYVERLTSYNEKNEIDHSFLHKHGFL